jgi:hypothetical protein
MMFRDDFEARRYASFPVPPHPPVRFCVRVPVFRAMRDVLAAPLRFLPSGGAALYVLHFFCTFA